MGYKVKVIDYQEANLTESDVMSISEAARTLDITMPGVIRAIERGALTEVIDDNASYHGRRLVFRKEIERLVGDRSEEKSTAASGAKPKTAKTAAAPAKNGGTAEKAERLKETRVSFYVNRPRNDVSGSR
jgi:FKBP-type peptidyl-prolyl cis-trans isomerase 2